MRNTREREPKRKRGRTDELMYPRVQVQEGGCKRQGESVVWWMGFWNLVRLTFSLDCSTSPAKGPPAGNLEICTCLTPQDSISLDCFRGSKRDPSSFVWHPRPEQRTGRIDLTAGTRISPSTSSTTTTTTAARCLLLIHSFATSLQHGFSKHFH